jgi:hypothetical protein
MYLSAESAEQHSLGRKPWDWAQLKSSPERAAQAASPFQGSSLWAMDPRVPLRSTLGCAAPRFQRYAQID